MSAKQKARSTSAQQAMVEVWEKHMAAEFQAKSLEATLATMTADPSVNHVPVLTGGVGWAQVSHFYGTHFIPHHPPRHGGGAGLSHGR